MTTKRLSSSRLNNDDFWGMSFISHLCVSSPSVIEKPYGFRTRSHFQSIVLLFIGLFACVACLAADRVCKLNLPPQCLAIAENRKTLDIPPWTIPTGRTYKFNENVYFADDADVLGLVDAVGYYRSRATFVNVDFLSHLYFSKGKIFVKDQNGMGPGLGANTSVRVHSKKVFSCPDRALVHIDIATSAPIFYSCITTIPLPDLPWPAGKPVEAVTKSIEINRQYHPAPPFLPYKPRGSADDYFSFRRNQRQPASGIRVVLLEPSKQADASAEESLTASYCRILRLEDQLNCEENYSDTRIKELRDELEKLKNSK